KQVDFCTTIHDSGNDLLALINDILDLSKIESGTVTMDIGELSLVDLRDYVDRNFRHVADAKHLEFSVVVDSRLPEVIETDVKRLQQVIKNLLSNAFKFTPQGRVSFEIAAVPENWTSEVKSLQDREKVIALTVSDTGIGIHPDKQQIIFEA